MRLLAWDTSSKSGALAAVEWDHAHPKGAGGLRLVSEWTLNIDATHSERLLWAVDELLQSCRWDLASVDCFAVGVGPGSFTGLRIGMTTARTLADAMKKPLIGVSSLAALARPAALWCAEQKERVVLVATTDACKGELFGLFGSARSLKDCVTHAEDDHAGLWKRGVDEGVYAPTDLMKLVKRRLGEGSRAAVQGARWMAVGEGRRRYESAWAELAADREWVAPIPFGDQVQGRYVAQLAWEAYQAGLAREPLKVYPRYLRAADAELKLKAGLLPKGPTRG